MRKIAVCKCSSASDCPWLALLPHNDSGDVLQPLSEAAATAAVYCLCRNAPEFVLSNFPGCKRLEDAYRKIYHIPNKTPLSVLYEYASRLNLTVRVKTAANSTCASLPVELADITC